MSREEIFLAGSPQFATTQWSMVVSAGDQVSPNSRNALESLCQSYWFPLYAYARRRVPNIDEAQDLTQTFFVELIEKNYLRNAVPERGRFRAFLLTAFKHFLAKQYAKSQTFKRGGGKKLYSLDFHNADSKFCFDPATNLTAEQLYDRQWALALLNQVIQQLSSQFAEEGKQVQFDALCGFLLGDNPTETYANVAIRLGMSEAAAKKVVSRMRERYRHLLRRAILETVEGPDEIDAEIRSLFTVLQIPS